MRGHRRLTTAALALAALALAAPSAIARGDNDHRHGKKTPKPPVSVQLLGLNDFHGNLEPPAGSSGTIAGTTAGGIEYLATHIRNLEAANPNSLVVSAGDLIGASPLLSAAFHDEPTIEAMNKLGLDLNAVGNHEFDEGETELRRMAAGGCHPTDGCQDGDGFGGAEFGFLAANVVSKSTGRPMFAPYAIREFDGERIGFIGMTLEGTPDIVSPGGIANLDFLDEADTANHYAKRLHRRGVDAVVVLLHEGAVQDPASSPINDCAGIGGPIVDIVSRTTPDVDLFVTGHTHQPYRCLLASKGKKGKPGPLRAVTSASSFGRLVTDIDLQIDRKSGDVIHSTLMAENKIVDRTVTKALDMSALIQRYTTFVAPIRDEVIGSSTGVISRSTAPDNGDESPAGNLIADAQLAASSSPTTGAAVAAFMNPGGVRADFPSGNITYGAAFNVQPFGNNLVTITLTGEQLYRMLKSQWCGLPSRRVLQPSDTVRYTYDPAKAIVGPPPGGTPCASAPDDVITAFTINGQPVPRDASQSYRITVNSFLADGGDGFPVLREGTDRLGGEVDTKALQDYIRPSVPPNGTPIAPPATTRISRTTG
jgi:5'-nucleotidase